MSPEIPFLFLRFLQILGCEALMWHSDRRELPSGQRDQWLKAALHTMKLLQKPPNQTPNPTFDLYLKSCLKETFYTLNIAFGNFDLAEKLLENSGRKISVRFRLDAIFICCACGLEDVYKAYDDSKWTLHQIFSTFS